MIRKLITGIVVVAAGLGIYAFIKSRGPEAASDEEKTTSVVTVQTGALTNVTLHRYVEGYGTVEPAPATADQPAAGAMLASPVAGVVARVNVIIGQQVKKGDVLAELNSGALTVDSAVQEVERQKQLYAQQNTALKNLQTAEAQLASLRIIAPLSGTVARLNVKAGESVDVNTAVAEVIDLNRLAVSAAIPAAEAKDLKTGQDVQVLTDPPATTTLAFISPAVDASSGTVLARANLAANSRLRPGQFVQLKIITAVHASCLAAPAESVVTDESGHSVIALVKGDEAAQSPVQTGLRENGWVEISGTGLKAGDTVVTIGAYGLPEKTKIHVLGSAAGVTTTTNSTPAK
ncbi:MAG TPA: efflux RND transporter periplasmic adaptor subunit [Verrucomicrobiae bacterium]